MTRALYRYDKELKKLVEVDLNYSSHELPNTPYIITDTMDATVHPCDGRRYDSKRKFRETTRLNGCIEIGNETQSYKPQKLSKEERRVSIADAYEKIKYGKH